jgi:phospholipase/carboxylesterase
VLDRTERLDVITPQAPLTLPGWGGYHWYVVPQGWLPGPRHVPQLLQDAV